MKLSECVGSAIAIVTLAVLLSACPAPGSADGLAANGNSGRRVQARSKEAVAQETPGVVAAAVNAADGGEPASVAELELGPPRVAVPVADQLRLYLQSEFGTPGSESSWYHRIRRVAVGFHTATIHTDLTSDAGDRAAVKAICQAVSGFQKSRQGRDVTELDIDVLGAGGGLLARAPQAPAQPFAGIRPGTTPIHAPQHNSPVFLASPRSEASPRSTPSEDR